MEKYFLVVEIEINHHCNLACTYCPNSNTKRNSSGLMSFKEFEIIINQLCDINYKGRICYHFYNEPLLHPELDKFVKYSKEQLPESFSEIFTNGTYLTRERFFELRTAGVDKFTVTKHSGLKTIAFDSVFDSLSEIERSHVKYLNYQGLVYSNRGGLVDFGKKIDSPLHRPCLIPTSTVVITVNGNVLTCYEDYHEKNIVGNIFSEHIREIWKKPDYVQFREDLKKGMRSKYEVCKTCNNLQVVQ